MKNFKKCNPNFATKVLRQKFRDEFFKLGSKGNYLLGGTKKLTGSLLQEKIPTQQVGGNKQWQHVAGTQKY